MVQSHVSLPREGLLGTTRDYSRDYSSEYQFNKKYIIASDLAISDTCLEKACSAVTNNSKRYEVVKVYKTRLCINVTMVMVRWAVVELGTLVAIAHLQSKTTVVKHPVAISTRSTH